MKDNNDFLTSLLLRGAFVALGSVAAAYAGFTYKSISAHEERLQMLEKNMVEIRTTLKLALDDIRYHHQGGDVKVSH